MLLIADLFAKKVLIDPNLIHALSEYISHGPNYGAPLLAYHFEYGISCHRYTRYQFKRSDNIFMLKTGIPFFCVNPEIFDVRFEKVISKCGRTDIAEKY